MVVDLWYAHQPWVGPDRDEVTARIINRAISLVEEYKPLLPGVRDAIALCKAQGLKVGLASASPLHMLEKVLTMFGLRDSFDALASAEKASVQQATSAGVYGLRRETGAGSAYLCGAGRFG